MHDFFAEPLASSFRLIFILWVILGFWTLLFTPLFAKLKTNRIYTFPRWWKLLLIIYGVSITLALVIAYLVARNPGDITTGITYGIFLLTILTIFVGFVGSILITLFKIGSASRKTDKTEFQGMAKRTGQVVLIILTIVLVNWLIGRFQIL